jgi:hypothetical protein
MVGGAEEVPGAVAGQAWADEAVSYTVAWWPPDPAEAEREVPSASYLEARTRAAAVVDALARALAVAVDGVLVDADGFPVV